MTIWTIGHSTRPLEEFLDALRGRAIERLVDVRRFPGSRRHPHFGGPALAGTLAGAGIRYLHLPELGGRRRPRPDSPHVAWRDESFRGYADHMDTPEFAAAFDRLLATAETGRSAILCAEALWWRCHRGLISDLLKARGHDVLHVNPPGPDEPHPYTSAARIVAGRLDYGG